jgi:hypothetical protein
VYNKGIDSQLRSSVESIFHRHGNHSLRLGSGIRRLNPNRFLTRSSTTNKQKRDTDLFDPMGQVSLPPSYGLHKLSLANAESIFPRARPRKVPLLPLIDDRGFCKSLLIISVVGRETYGENVECIECTFVDMSSGSGCP